MVWSKNGFESGTYSRVVAGPLRTQAPALRFSLLICRETVVGKANGAPTGAPRRSKSIADSRLLDGAADVREHVVGVRADEPDRTHHDHQNYGQHHGILSDILTTLIVPQVL